MEIIQLPGRWITPPGLLNYNLPGHTRTQKGKDHLPLIYIYLISQPNISFYTRLLFAFKGCSHYRSYQGSPNLWAVQFFASTACCCLARCLGQNSNVLAGHPAAESQDQPYPSGSVRIRWQNVSSSLRPLHSNKKTTTKVGLKPKSFPPKCLRQIETIRIQTETGFTHGHPWSAQFIISPSGNTLVYSQ